MLSVTLVDKEGRENHMFLNTDANSLHEFFRYRVGEDRELAKALFPMLGEEEITFIINHRKPAEI